MKSRLLLDIVIRESAAVLELLSRKDQTLLVRRNAFLVLDLALDVVDGIGGLDLKSDGLACDYEDVSIVLLLKVGGDDAMRPRKGENLRVLTKICILTVFRDDLF